MSSILKPVCDELPINVNVNLLQLSITVVREFVRHIRGDNNDLACNCLEGSGINCESRYTFLNNKDLFVRMLMQSDNPSWRHIHPNKRDFAIFIIKALKFISVPVSR